MVILLLVGYSQSYTGGAVTSDNMKYIESSLANISARVADLQGPDTAITHSLTSVTSLLQLSLLKGLLADTTSKNDMSDFDGQEAKVAFNRLETLMNTTVNNQQLLQDQVSSNQQTITELQELVSAMFSTLNSVQKNVNKILQQTSPNATSSDDAISSSLPRSCQEIKATSPDPVSSGYYTIADSDGLTRHVYCHMGELCGSDEGWTRIAYLDMRNGEEKCPDGLRLYEVNGVRACGRPSSGCASVSFPFEGISYSEVCGKVIGYQYYSTDGADSSKGINDIYLDGISLTHGYPRSHIWSFISGYYESGSRSACPCGSVGSQSAPSFVGKHYFCEAATVPPWKANLYTDDPLWDGKGCGSIERACCNLPGLPWFHRSFSYTTSDYIEMRVCGDEDNNNEDAPVTLFEIYVKE